VRAIVLFLVLVLDFLISAFGIRASFGFKFKADEGPVKNSRTRTRTKREDEGQAKRSLKWPANK
jgi:hypothetical protein